MFGGVFVSLTTMKREMKLKLTDKDMKKICNTMACHRAGGCYCIWESGHTNVLFFNAGHADLNWVLVATAHEYMHKVIYEEVGYDATYQFDLLQKKFTKHGGYGVF